MKLFQGKSKSIVLLALFLVVFIIPWKTQALLVPQVYLTKLDITENSFEPGEQIEGNVILWNYEESVMSDLVLSFQLLGQEIEGVFTQVINEQKDQKAFSIPASEILTKPFIYSLPSNLPKGNFAFRVQLITGRGEEMGWIDKILNIGGEGEFLVLDNYWIIKDEENLSPGGGVDYQPGEIPQISFDITNNTDFTILAFPEVTTFRRNVGGEVIETQEGKDVLLSSGRKKTIKTNLPQLNESGTYLSEVQLYLKDGQKPVSNSIFFRWVIPGDDDARILFVSTDKESYQVGEEAKVSVQFTGPAHLYIDESEVSQGEFEIQLYDNQGNIIGEKKAEIELKSGQALINVPIESDVDDLRIEARIIKEGNILDQYGFQVGLPNGEEAIKDRGVVSFLKSNKWLIGALIIILITMLIYLKTKKKKILKAMALLAMIGSGVLFLSTSVLAATEVTGGYCDTTIIFNTPLPSQTYSLGDVINFTGKFRVTSCGDGLFHNKIEFFITADENIPLETDNCCGDCCGALSETYGGCLQNRRWCNEVKTLPLQSNVYKLGTIYPQDVHSGARPYWVEYNNSFYIPEDLGFSGPVRFYVQYSGTHWKSHWHWNVTYQKGDIGDVPIAKISCDASGCDSSGCVGYTDCPFILLNDSASAYKSSWDILDWGTSPDLSCDYPTALCDFTPQLLPPGDYVVTLSVETATGLSDETSKNFSVLQEIAADFQCSLDNVVWQDCEDVKFNPQKAVYFSDQSSSSDPVGGNYITERRWTFENGDPVQILGNETNPLTRFQSQGPKEVVLSITDNQGRTVQKIHQLSVIIPDIQWGEVSPIGWIRRFLANISTQFRNIFS